MIGIIQGGRGHCAVYHTRSSGVTHRVASMRILVPYPMWVLEFLSGIIFSREAFYSGLEMKLIRPHKKVPFLKTLLFSIERAYRVKRQINSKNDPLKLVAS